ncbi:MAG: hypothetical protein KF819_33855 [Labilithrix sp.]|nr:hypothetical protein [Labilithrix sp.]
MRTALFSALSTMLLLTIGCAAGPADGPPEDEADDVSVPEVKVDNVGIDANGMTCSCPAGQQFQNGLCYPACAAGWSGEGPVCWQPCQSTFTDTGFFCHRDSKIIKADTGSCPWYDKCGVAAKKGCSKCPSGYKNDGCTCRIDAYIYAQPSYGRGAGTTPSCSTY